MTGMSLLDVLRGVMLDPAEQAAYNADPRAYLAQFGFGDVDPADLSEAVGLVADTLPPDQAQAALSSTVTGADSSFGDVTADFDAEPPGEPPAPAAPGEPFAAEPAGDDGGEATSLSFGRGGDVDDPTFDEAPDEGPALDATACDDGLAGVELAEGPDDGGLDDPLGQLHDEPAGLHADDELDDLDDLDDDLASGDPDDFDIGSF